MFNILKLGQGPRPDLLEEELRKKAAKLDAEEKAAAEAAQNPQPEKQPEASFDSKDRWAIIIALFQLLLPWIGAGILIYFLVIWLVTR